MLHSTHYPYHLVGGHHFQSLYFTIFSFSSRWYKFDSNRKPKKHKKTMSHVEEEDGEPLSPMARVFHSPGNNCCIVTMIGCKTKINADVILLALNHNVSKHPRFSSKLVTKYLMYYTHTQNDSLDLTFYRFDLHFYI